MPPARRAAAPRYARSRAAPAATAALLAAALALASPATVGGAISPACNADALCVSATSQYPAGVAHHQHLATCSPSELGCPYCTDTLFANLEQCMPCGFSTRACAEEWYAHYAQTYGSFFTQFCDPVRTLPASLAQCTYDPIIAYMGAHRFTSPPRVVRAEQGEFEFEVVPDVALTAEWAALPMSVPWPAGLEEARGLIADPRAAACGTVEVPAAGANITVSAQGGGATVLGAAAAASGAQLPPEAQSFYGLGVAPAAAAVGAPPVSVATGGVAMWSPAGSTASSSSSRRRSLART